jgi:replicative DNA helicase
MNPAAALAAFSKASPFDTAIKALPYNSGAERSVIAGLLAKPDLIAEVTAKLVPADFEGEFHRRVIDILIGLHGEGRRPSIEAVVAVTGDDEVAPNLTVRGYLRGLIADSLGTLLLPFDDALETIKDASQRKALSEAGNDLMFGATSGGKSVADLAGEAVARIDDVMASLRSAKRRHYDAAGAGQSAIDLISRDVAPSPTTGLTDLDRMLGGWPRGELSVIAGRPGTGKSAVATSTVLRAARAGHPVCFFSLEMRDEQLGARMLTDLAFTQGDPIFYEDILKRRIPEERQRARLQAAQQQLKGLPIHIEEQRGLTMAEISARSRKTAAAFERAGTPLQIVVVDHLHIIRSSNRYAGNRVRELAEISDGLATLAKELNVAVVALCQLNRGVEGRDNKRPSMPDLRESGSIEEDASVIIFLYRAAYYLEKQRFDDRDAERARQDMLEQVRNKIEFGVDKNRNGRVGIVDAFVDIGANAIRNASFGGR